MKTLNLKRILAILLSLCLTLSILPATVFAAADGGVTLTIIHVNDRHGRMGADPYISQLAKDTDGNVLIFDAGDALHGQITANLSEGATMVELMNVVGYSAMVTGNHEYTYGIDRLLELSEMMDFPLLAANVRDADGKNLFQSCEIFKMDGITVGVFGIATPETVASSDPRLMAGLVFDDPVKTAQAEVAELKTEGCDIIIALAHLGLDDLSDPKDRSDTLATVDGIDVIIDGHSHTKLENGLTVGDTLIAQTGEYGQNIGVIEVTISGDKVSKTAKLIPVPAEGEETAIAADEKILAKIAELDAENEAVTSVVVGYTPVLLRGEKTESRIGGTNLADLITDSMRYATGADMAFMTGGNIRASIDAGDITMGEVLTTLPYSNLLVTVELTGADILKILEHGVAMYPEAVGEYIHVSGLRFTFDPNAEAGSRVKTVTLSDGSTLAPDKTYTVATIDFIAAGGDGYDMMANGKNLKYYGGDAEAFINYLAANPTINAESENRAMASASQTKDIAGHWAAAAIETCLASGLMSIDGQGNFNPDAAVTADEARELLAALLTDSKTSIGGNGLLTREQLAVMLIETLSGYELAEISGAPTYADAGLIGGEYKNAVDYAYKTALMRGIGGGRFDPKGIVTRAQMAAVISNVINAGLSVADNGKTYNSLSDFDGAAIGALTGTAFAEFIDPIVTGVKYTYYPSQAEMVAALLGGEVDAIALDMPVAKYVAVQNAGLAVFSETVSPDSYGFALVKGSPLTDKANAALQKLKDNGTIAEIEKIWFSTDQSAKILPTLDYKADYDGSAGTLRYGCDNSTEPMSYINEDGQPVGFDLDIVSRIAYELNMTVEFYPMGFDNVFAALTSGEVDMAGGSMSLTEQRIKTYDCVGPYYDGGVVLVVKTQRPSVENSRLGVMVGSTNEKYADTHYPDAAISRYNNYVESVAALLDNKIDYSMMDYTSALSFIRNNKLLEIVSDFLTDEKLCLGINKNNPELAKQFSDVLDKYMNDGTLDEIISHWIKPDGSDYTITNIPKHENAPTLTVAIIATREPTTFVIADEYAGLDIELIGLIAYEMGYNVEYVNMELAGLLTSMENGEADICMGIYKTPEREQQMLFTAPYFTNPQVLVAKKQATRVIKGEN